MLPVSHAQMHILIVGSLGFQNLAPKFSSSRQQTLLELQYSPVVFIIQRLRETPQRKALEMLINTETTDLTKHAQQ